MPPTAELLRQLKPPPEIKLITQFCDDVLRRRRPQRLTLVKPMPLRAVPFVKTPLLLTGRWGPIPEEEVSVWPTLFHAQDIEVADVETFLTWLKRMQTRESGWLFAYPEMTFPPRPMAPFLDSEAPASELQAARLPFGEQPTFPPPLTAQPGALPGLPAIQPGYVPVRGMAGTGGYVPARRPPAAGGGFVPTGEQADGMRRTIAAQRLRAIEAEAAPPKPPLSVRKGAVPLTGVAASPPISVARSNRISPNAIYGIAAPAPILLAGMAASRMQARPLFTPITAASWSGTPFSPEAPNLPLPARAVVSGAQVTGQFPPAADRNWATYARAPSPFGGPIPIPYSQPSSPMLTGKVTWQLSAGREQTSYIRVPLPLAVSAPSSYPLFTSVDYRGMPAPGITGQSTTDGDWTRHSRATSSMMTGKVTWQLPAGREQTSYMRVPMPLVGSAPIPYPQFDGADFGGRLAPIHSSPLLLPARGITGQSTLGAGGDWTRYARVPSPIGVSIPVPYPHIPVNAAGFMAAGMQQAGAGQAPGELPQVRPLAPGTLLENPYIGQMTLISPPLRVASEEAEDSGTAVAFNWETLTKGQGALDARGLSALRRALPENAQLIYPALPKGQLPAGAVNLRLAQPTVAHLLQAGYGLPPGAGVAARAISGTEAAIGATPPAMPLTGHIVPGKRPAGTKESLLPSHAAQPGGELPRVGAGQAKRGSALDFLGLPISLAPSLGGRSDVREAVSSNVASDKIAGIIRPNIFEPLRRTLFPSFHSIEAEPDRPAWQQAAPSFGLRDDKPLTVLSPQARAPIITPSSPLPQLGGESPSAPGSLPQMHVAEPAPVRHAMETSGGMPPTMTPPSPPAAVFGGMPGRPFRPITEPTIGPGMAPHAAPTSMTIAWAGAPRQGIFSVLPAPLSPFAPPSIAAPGETRVPAVSPMPSSPPFFSGAAPAPGTPASARGLVSLRPSPASPRVGAGPTARPSGMPAFSLPEPPAMSLPPLAGGVPDMPSPDMRLPAMSTATSPGSGMRASTSLVSRAPARLYTPPVPRVMTAAAPLAIQRSVNIGQVDSEVQSERQAAGQAATQTEREGQQGAEINLLATEVWSLLKQRLATEAIRRGRW